MVSDIQPIDLGDRTPSDTVDDTETVAQKNGTISMAVLDIENTGGELSDDNNRLPLLRAEKTELIPEEAFRWDVSGDQSPCTPICDPSLHAQGSADD
jgi:hypothetical protein